MVVVCGLQHAWPVLTVLCLAQENGLLLPLERVNNEVACHVLIDIIAC